MAGTCKFRIVFVDGCGVDDQFNVICNIGSALANADNGAKALQMGSQFGLFLESEPDMGKFSFKRISARPLMLMPPMPMK